MCPVIALIVRKFTKNRTYSQEKRIFAGNKIENNMNFIAIIPARYASSRFPGKPLADIMGKPMVQHVYERASRVFEHCCVATDDKRIADAVEGFGGIAVMTSTEHRSGTDRCAEALMHYEQHTGITFDVVVNVQGDEPFISDEHLVSLREAFNDPAADIATLAYPMGADDDIFNPNSPKIAVSRNGYALYFSRSVIPYMRGVEQTEWAARHTYLKHIGIYGYRAATLREITALPQGELERMESLEQLRWLENDYRIKVCRVSAETVGIDTPEDLERLRAKLSI